MYNSDNKTEKINSISVITKGVITARNGVVLSHKFYDYGWSETDYFRDIHDNTLRYEEGLSCVHLNGKYGFVGLNGEEVIPLIYDYADDFSEGLALVMVDGEYGFIDKKGKTVIPFRDYQWCEGFSEGLATFRVYGKYGFINKKGEWQIVPIYDSVEQFEQGVSIASYDNKYGVIDKTGKAIIPFKYEYMRRGYNRNHFEVKLHSKFGLINRDGDIIIPIKYDYIDQHIDLDNDTDKIFISVSRNHKFGFIDKTGKEIIPLIYDSVGDFEHGLAVVEVNTKYGIIDEKGSVVAPLIYDLILNPNTNFPVMLNDKWGAITPTGAICIPIKYENLSFVDENLVQAVYNNKLGYIDSNNNIVIPFKYAPNFRSYYGNGLSQLGRLDGSHVWVDIHGNEYNSEAEAKQAINWVDEIYELREFEKYPLLKKIHTLINQQGQEIPLPYNKVYAIDLDLFKVELDGQWGIINQNGEEIVSPQYDAIGYRFHQNITPVYLNNKIGFIDKTGEEVIPLIFNGLSIMDEGLFGVRLEDKWGLINRDGKEIAPFIYDYLANDDWDVFVNEVVRVSRNGKDGFLDKTGSECIALKYDFANFFWTDLAPVCINHKWGCIDNKGREVIPLMYDYVDTSHESLIVILDDKYGVIDSKSGDIIIPLEYDNIRWIDNGRLLLNEGGEWEEVKSKDLKMKRDFFN